MKSDTPLDYAVFQLSPKRSRCELFVSSAGNTEKLASGLVKPFVTHLKVAEEQLALSFQSIKLEVERRRSSETWFTKGTLERFVRFVSTPEVLDLVNTFDTEMSQLEAARRMYSQGAGDQFFSTLNGGEATTAADGTKKELLKAIDVRLVAVKQDLTTACARAAAAGFTPYTLSELQLFADYFGAKHLNEACSKFISLCERRPDLIDQWKAGVEDQAVRSSYGSDMSIDEYPTEKQGSGPTQPQGHHLDNKHPTGQESEAAQRKFEQSQPSTWQQASKNSSVIVKAESDGAVDTGESVNQDEPPRTAQHARRLSVQDRINLFENKQKETSGGSGGKPVAVGKSVEFRRLSSDVSSAPAAVERAVLRRWSGASDMSIDLSYEKKDIGSPLCTPSAPVSQTKSEERNPLSDTTATEKPLTKSVPARAGDSASKHQTDPEIIRGGAASGKEVVVETKLGTNPGTPNNLSTSVESDGWKEQPRGKTQSRTSFCKADDDSLKDQVPSQTTHFRSLPGGIAEQIGLADQRTFAGDEHGGRKEPVASGTQIVRQKDRAVPQSQFGAFVSKERDVGSTRESHQLPNKVEGAGSRGPEVSQFRAPPSTASFSGHLEGRSGLKAPETFADSLASKPHLRSFGEASKGVEVGKKSSGSSEKLPSNFTTKVEDSGLQQMKFQKQASAPEQIKMLQSTRGEISSDYRNSRPFNSVKVVSEGQEDFGSVSTVSREQVQMVRQSKRNQELNDELKMKANELEKLFAEHKLRVPVEQSSSAQRNKSADIKIEPATVLPNRKPPAEISPAPLPDHNTEREPLISSSNMSKFIATPPMKILDKQDYGDALMQNFSELGLSEDSRGKFYEKYVQKRDAKLREEWGSKRADKEAKMKAMQDSFDRNRAEMKAKLSGSADRHDSALGAWRRTERVRSFNSRSATKKEQHPINILQTEDEEDLSYFAEQKTLDRDRSFRETSFGDGASKSTQIKKVLPNKNFSSTPRTSGAPAPRSAVKASNSGTGRRRMQSENPLAQSVPNFSDLRKENTKPSSGVSKTTARSQARNYVHSRSTNEEIPLIKEEKPRQSQSLRKSSASHAEFKDLPSPDTEGIVLTPLKFDKEQTEPGLYEKSRQNGESKPDAGAVIAKMKSSTASKNNIEELDQLDYDPEESMDLAEDDEEGESEAIFTVPYADMGNGKRRLSQESDKLVNSGSESGDILRPFSPVDPSFVDELPAAVHPVSSVQDSPGESPVSWNSRVQHAFSYVHETSDVDVSADSPMGSPASWNSHPLNQTEADAARMRKKWGSAQKPILVSNSSHNHSRKDMTNGFKRLLKFGRKSRGTETLVDWISATTSEGDDDTEDGRDPANRSSEDLRKSRMGFSHGHPSDGSFNESEFFSEQVQALRSSIPAPPTNFKLREDNLSGSSIKAPRSFFSLSTFRSKGSDSKPR